MCVMSAMHSVQRTQCSVFIMCIQMCNVCAMCVHSNVHAQTNSCVSWMHSVICVQQFFNEVLKVLF